MKNTTIILGALGIFFLFGCGTTEKIDSQFPLPENITTFIEQDGADQINFQTDLSLMEIFDFYNSEFINQGLVERTLVTVKEDSVISVVFDGHESGKAVVVQATKLSPESTNVNIRLEEM